MARSKIHVGLEIGTTKTVMVVAEIKPDHSVKILGLGETKTAGVRKGEISDYPLARSCVKAALLQAEDVSDVVIKSVFISVTGAHIKGENSCGTFRLPDEDSEIDTEHLDEAKEIARDIAIPSDHVYLHHLIRNYSVDGQDCTMVPLGLSGRTLESNFHIVHGVRARIQNSIKCVREIPLDVDDVVFAPVASAQIALTRENKDAGALVLDIGGGTTDYVCYINGAIAASGCVPVGGEHVTNDIHLITHIPHSKAEQLKKEEGDATADPARSLGTINVLDDSGYPVMPIQRQLLNDIIRGRMEETLSIVRDQIPAEIRSEIGTGVFLTGGASQLRGLGDLAFEVFNMPVFYPEQPDVSGVQAYFKDPQYSTALGLIRYAQILEEERAESMGSRFSEFLRSLWPF